MKILSRTSCILSYSISPDFFNGTREISSTNKTGRGYWEPTEHGSHKYTNILTFDAGDSEGENLFIQYRAVMTCDVLIEEVKHDVIQMLTFEQEFNESMVRFIKDNSLSYIPELELHLPSFTVNEWNTKQMEDGMRHVMSTSYDEKRTEVLKQMKGNIDFEPKVKTKVTITSME